MRFEFNFFRISKNGCLKNKYAKNTHFLEVSKSTCFWANLPRIQFFTFFENFSPIKRLVLCKFRFFEMHKLKPRNLYNQVLDNTLLQKLWRKLFISDRLR